MEDAVAVVFEVEDVVEGFESGAVIGEPLGGEEALVRLGFVSLQENTLAVPQMGVSVVFRHLKVRYD